MSCGPSHQAPGQRQVVYGYVSHHQPLPTHYDDPLYVILPDWDQSLPIECPRWPKIHGRTFPQAGAEVVLLFNDRHNPRVVWWDGEWTEWDIGPD